jgi:hypothetical protein
LIDDHKTRTIEYAYQRFTDFLYEDYRAYWKSNDVPEEDRKRIDSMWSRLMQNGAEGFFLEEAAVAEDEIDFEIANFFIWVYQRDGWTTFRPYWQILRITWRNYKAMGLELFFESTEGYYVEKP